MSPVGDIPRESENAVKFLSHSVFKGGVTLDAIQKGDDDQTKGLVTVDNNNKTKYIDPFFDRTYFYSDLKQPNINEPGIPIDDVATLELTRHHIGVFNGNVRTGAHLVNFSLFLEASKFVQPSTLTHIAQRIDVSFMALVLPTTTHYSDLKVSFNGIYFQKQGSFEFIQNARDDQFKVEISGKNLLIQNQITLINPTPVYMKYTFNVNHFQTLTQ